jgi:hypothetical protein
MLLYSTHPKITILAMGKTAIIVGASNGEIAAATSTSTPHGVHALEHVLGKAVHR